MRITIWAVCNLCLFLNVLVLTADESRGEQVRVEKIPHDYIILAESVVDDLGAFKKASVAWPTESTINAQCVDQSRKGVQEACASTLHWLRTVLHADLVPRESEVQLIPLKSHVEGHDAVRLRYKTDDFVVQVLSTSWAIAVVIKESRKDAQGKPMEIDQAKTYMRLCIDRFLNKADRVKSVSMENVRKTNHGVVAKPDIKSETCNHWWGLVSWWTDGTTVLLSIGKADGGATEPPVIKNWFSGE